MGSVKDDEDFWYSSEKRSFCFENNDIDSVFGVSKNETDKLWAGISNAPTLEGYVLPKYETDASKPILSVISEKTLCSILSMDKLQSGQKQSTVQQPDITLSKITLGQPYTLEQYKSLARKTALLDAAILSGDGNAILTIIVFLTKTLKRHLIQRLFVERQEAVNAYIRYVSTRLQLNEVADILTMLGRSIEAAMKTLHISIRTTRDSARLLQKLRNSYKTQFTILTDCKETTFVHCYIKLLEWQQAVKDAGNDDEIKINSSVCECLQYICKKYWNVPEASLMSPILLSQQHSISPRLFEKVGLRVKASAGEWHEIDALVLTKGWLRSKKLQTSIHIEDVLKIIHQAGAPIEILDKYLIFVDNIPKRLQLAKEMRSYRIAIDILVQQGDRIALTEYKSQLVPQSEGYFYAEGALRLPSVRWRN